MTVEGLCHNLLTKTACNSSQQPPYEVCARAFVCVSRNQARKHARKKEKSQEENELIMQASRHVGLGEDPHVS